ncbi:MAG TPA: TonB family protein [Bryobacteraceae bacterium]|nr:TonB family protein [Bryobacteraceae bacterium]
MSESQKHHNRYDAEIAVHDAQGNVKLSLDAEDHLGRLLAPDTDVPWFKSIIENVKDLFNKEELPPLELTSKPVAVKDIWGEGTNPKRVASSVIIHGAVFAALILIGTNDKVQKAVKNVVLIAPPPPPTKTVEVKKPPAGGGQRSPLPALKASLPKPAPRQFTPPLVTIEHPALTMDPSLVAAPDAWAAPTGAIGNPLGAIGGGGGLGSGGGIGNGRGTGIGNGSGAGAGGAGVYSVGNGITAPELISKVEPEYSEEARKAKYSGSVLLSIVVNTDGKAEDIKVVKSLGMGLDEKAIEAVQKWRFRPGKNKGVPVKVKAQIEVNFRLL